MGQISYALCAATSVVCFILLIRGYLKNKTPLLLWSSLCFCFLAIQNALLFVDLVLIPEISMAYWRTLSGFLGPAILLCGLIWEKR